MKSGTFIYQMQVPVRVLYSVDGRVSVDSVSLPDYDDIYNMVDKNAQDIKRALKLHLEGET